MKLTVEENPETIKRYSHIRPAPPWRAARCSVTCPGTTRACTLEKGHRGPHVAHGRFGKVVAVWDDRSMTRKLREPPKPGKIMARRVKSPPRRESVDRGFFASLKAFLGGAVRQFPAVEEVFLILLGLGMIWFAVETALRILGWR